ncbi:MAG: DNA sulfur modification protein DndB [Acidobacteriota bacterium]
MSPDETVTDKLSSVAGITKISVIVPKNPFAPPNLQGKSQCLCALDVIDLMRWWPGEPHSPHRKADKVRAIQRSLDWKRVAEIAAYLLQQEITDAQNRINKYFKKIYQPKENEPGRQWPPRISSVIGYQRSSFPTFSNVLLHVTGAKIDSNPNEPKAANLVFNEKDKNLNFTVIDGQHRINGAYFAVNIRREMDPAASWEIPAEVFLDLDPPGSAPRIQAQIFIDVNFYQKKVDRSLVADLFPTARIPLEGERKDDDLFRIERAQDIGRRLMLETGPLVGMIQIPGIRYGVKDVITLATLNSAIRDVLPELDAQGIHSLDGQTEFLAQCLTAWLEASGRFESKQGACGTELTPENVAYQGRILVSVLALVPAMIWRLKKASVPHLVSDSALDVLIKWLRNVTKRAGLIEDGMFIGKKKFKARGYYGSGGIGRFRNTLWAAVEGTHRITAVTKSERIAKIAEKNRALIMSELHTQPTDATK